MIVSGKSLKHLLEIAGVDTSKGKAKLLVESLYVTNWLDNNGIHGYSINNGKINVNGDVRLKDGLGIPNVVMFGEVTGDFLFGGGIVKTLRGCPKNIGTGTFGGNFLCAFNELSNLIGGPKMVNGIYSAVGNPLTSISGLPTFVDSDLKLPKSVQHLEQQIRKICKIGGELKFQ